jgi:hypothetical protein
MQRFKKILSVFLVLCLLITIFISGRVNMQQNISGKASSICTVTPVCEKWILDNFSKYQTVEEVMVAYDNFACQNFTYEKRIYLQNFDFEGFITEKNYHGVCFEFTCTLKCVLLVLSQNFERFSDVKSYVCCVLTSDRQGHCYNIIYSNGKCYEIDVTEDATCYQWDDLMPRYYADYTGYTVEEIVNMKNDKLVMLL